MTAAVISINIPQALYQRLVTAAERLQKPIERVLVETLQISLPLDDDIPPTIRQEINQLVYLDDNTLQQVAYSQMNLLDQQHLDDLLDTQGMRPLTVPELQQLETLRLEYGRVLVRKARAFALLAERGKPLLA